MSDWQSIVRAHLQRSGLDAGRFPDAVDEIASHLERVHRAALAQGLDDEGAHASALRELEGLEPASFTRRPVDTRPRLPLAGLWHSVRAGWRSVTSRPGFSFGIVVMLALGLGFNVALYAIAESALLRPLPHHDPGRVVFLWQGLWPDGDGKVNSVLDYEDFAARSRSFSSLAAFNISFAPLTGGDTPEQINGSLVTPNFFDVLGGRALLGRTLAAGDEVPTVDRPIVISHSLWVRRFNQDPNIITQTLTLAGQTRRIVGVMPASFEHPDPFSDEITEYWSPMTITPGMRTARAMRYLRVIGRLAPGVSLETAQAEVEQIGESLRAEFGILASETNPVLRTIFDELVGDTRLWLLVCAAGAGLVLLLAMGNIVNLLLANTAARRRELAVRAALGASRGRLASQLISESVCLSVGGGLLGVALASLVLRGVLATGGDLSRLEEARIDASVWVFAVALSTLTGLLCGLWPALRVTGRKVMGDLAGARGSTGLEVSRARTWLIAGEMALAVPLVTGALLLSVTLWQMVRVNAGFDAGHATHFRVNLPSGTGQRYASVDQRLRFVSDLEARLRALPGVAAAGVVSSLPMGGLNNTGGRFSYEQHDGAVAEMSAGFRSASAGYFDALGIPVLQGRTFTDAPEDSASIVVNARFAQLAWPGRAAVGQRLRLSSDAKQWRTVIGVVGDVRHVRLTNEADPEVFWPYRSDAWAIVSVVVRSQDPQATLAQIRPAITALDSQLPVVALARVSDIIAATRGPAAFSASAATLFGGLAVALSAFGTFAVLSLLVGHRTREIGIRFALGASRARVRALVLRDALIPALAGCLVGLVLAAWLARTLASRVYGVDPYSPWVFVAAVTTLATMAGVATWLPARRAMRVDPAITLRADA